MKRWLSPIWSCINIQIFFIRSSLVSTLGYAPAMLHGTIYLLFRNFPFDHCSLGVKYDDDQCPNKTYRASSVFTCRYLYFTSCVRCSRLIATRFARGAPGSDRSCAQSHSSLLMFGPGFITIIFQSYFDQDDYLSLPSFQFQYPP